MNNINWHDISEFYDTITSLNSKFVQFLIAYTFDGQDIYYSVCHFKGEKVLIDHSIFEITNYPIWLNQGKLPLSYKEGNWYVREQVNYSPPKFEYLKITKFAIIG